MRFLNGDGKPSAPVIIEGASSFITPEARDRLQEAGAVLFRDASANKCGVISSSYEIIGNLLLSQEEFPAHKERYVKDVLAILEKRRRTRPISSSGSTGRESSAAGRSARLVREHHLT